MLASLKSLALKNNYLVTAADIEHVLELPNLSVLDLQGNRITDVDVVDVLAQMPELKVLYLQGNDVVKHVKQYRKTIIFRCRKLKYLDDRPVFDDERRRVEAWGKALEASNGDYKAAQEAEREEMDAIRREKKERDELNFLHFEQMMIDGRRKRKEEEEAAKQKKTMEQEQQPEQQDEVSAFSGERIVPVEDCAFIQREREKRWAAVVNADTDEQGTDAERAAASGSNQDDDESGNVPDQHDSAGRETETNADGDTGAIPVDARRLELLHQCATVGSGLHSSRDPFVESSFAAESAADAVRRQQQIKDKAHAKVQALKAKKAVDAAASGCLPAATRLVTCDSSVYLVDADASSSHGDSTDTKATSATPAAATKANVDATPPIMPPPAPGAASRRPLDEASAAPTPPTLSLPTATTNNDASHTNVNELD